MRWQEYGCGGCILVLRVCWFNRWYRGGGNVGVIVEESS